MTPIVLPTICALDCPDACSLHITVEGDRVTHLAGDPFHPVTQGFACVKMARYPQRQEQDDRLLLPQRRVGKKGEGRFETISWDTALDEIAERTHLIVKQHGPQSILPYCYGGTMGVIEGSSPFAFFRRLGALELDQTICAFTGGTAWEANYGPNKIGTDPEDLIHSKYVVLWGINALRSNSHVAPFLKEARKKGCHILHIDPYRNETSRFADEHWQIKVGTDAALALAIGNEIFRNNWQDNDYLNEHASGIEEYQKACYEWSLERAAEYCGISLIALRAMVRRFATGEASFIKVGYGMTRNEGGGNALRAITLLPALIGAWRKKGGGGCLSTSGAFGLNTQRVSGCHLIRPGSRHVNMNLLASELDPKSTKIRGLFVYNSNPAAVAPDSSRVRHGLSNDNLFTVVLEHFQTDTADYADYLLPATTFLEHTDVYTAYGHYYLQYSEPVVAARGQAKSNRWVFAELARRLDFDDECLFWTPKQIVEELLASSNPKLAGITAERLMRERSVKLKLPEPFLPFSDGSNFPDRKIRFTPAPKQIEFEVQPNADYPLRLISPPGPFILNTSMGNVPSVIKMAGGEPQIIIHPTDAAPLGILDGDQVNVVSCNGSIRRKVIVSEDSRPGVAVALGQWWPKLTSDRKSL
ncbi:MAG TPA: molybdopterin-dependent oxidoreductase, partial [Pirellula sp.]|nr:molybdopterin-dependent oxidoreductase [Pirellula sp.]